MGLTHVSFLLTGRLSELHFLSCLLNMLKEKSTSYIFFFVCHESCADRQHILPMHKPE